MAKEGIMVELVYCGPIPAPGTGIPLPEGWPMADHAEPDAALAKEKVASGLYKRALRPGKDVEAEAAPIEDPAKSRATGEKKEGE